MEDKRKIYTIVAIVAVAGVLASCLTAAVIGGAAGFLVARRQASEAAARAVPRSLEEVRPTEAPIPLPPAQWRVLPATGALLVEVVAGTPAEAAGLKAGDIIVSIDSTPIDRNHPLPDVLGQYRPGDRITVRFWRAGEEDSVQVSLGENPDDPAQPYLGVWYRMVGRSSIPAPRD